MELAKNNHLSLEEIQRYFEHPFVSKRREFIETYTFNDSFHNYYKEVILKNLLHRDALYVCDLIELETRIHIKDKEFLLRYLDLLTEKTHYLVKLEVLDLFLTDDVVAHISAKKIEDRLQNALAQKQMRIVKNQILLNLISLKTENLENYKNQLIKSLQSTKDHRSLIRTLHNLEKKEFSFLEKGFIQSIVNVIKTQNQSRSVADACCEFEAKTLQ